jgi:formylmethanofuran dehydrogenase subunit E
MIELIKKWFSKEETFPEPTKRIVTHCDKCNSKFNLPGTIEIYEGELIICKKCSERYYNKK